MVLGLNMLCAMLSAILLILAFPNFNLSYLAFIGFIPLFFGIQNSSPKRAFFISYICGFLFYAGVLYWLYHVTLIGLILLCLYLALYFGIFGFFIALLQSKEQRAKSAFFSLSSKLLALCSIPAIWAALEYLQANLFTGFGWALLGYSQYRNLPFIQIADFSSVYGVSFVIMMVNVSVWVLMRAIAKQRAKSKEQREGFFLYALCPWLFAALILVSVYGYGFFRLSEKGGSSSIRVSVIQGNIPQEVKWDIGSARGILDKYINMTRMTAFDNTDLIIWPETSFPGFFISDRELTGQVLDLAREIKTPILLGANTERGLKSFNSAVLVSKDGEALDKYDKIHLVPFGEYVPFSDKFPILRNLILGELGEFSPGQVFRIFKLTTYDLQLTTKFAALICYEDIFPELARGFVQNGARFLVVITNDAWYGKSGAPYQHTACSVFRAIENRVPIARCANTGYSCFIDSYGRIYDSVERNSSHLFISGHRTSVLLVR